MKCYLIPKAKTLSLLLILAMLTGAAFAGDTGTQQTNPGVSKLVVGTTDYMAGFDLTLDYPVWEYMMMFTHDGLVAYDRNGEILPQLAESWETTDIKKWIFHLVDNATWHDGEPFTSEDVKFTMEYTRDKKIAYGASNYKDIVSIETPDDQTVVVNLNESNYNFIYKLANAPIMFPKHIFENADEPKEFKDANLMLVGTGPYIFDSFDKAAGLVDFKANEDYWGGKPAIKTIEMRFFNNPDTMVMALQKNEIDTIEAGGMSPSYVPKLLEDSNIKIMTFDSLGIKNVLFFNNNKPPFNNKKLRNAISYAINYDELLNLMTAGYGYTPDAGVVLESNKDYCETRDLIYDPNITKSELDDLGYKDIDGDGFRETPEGNKFAPELLIINNAEYVRSADLLKNYFEDVGLNLQVMPFDDTTFWKMVNTDRVHDMALEDLGFWTTTSHKGFYSTTLDYRGYGKANVTDPDYIGIVDQLGITLNDDERRELACEIQNYYADELPMIPLYAMYVVQPYNKKYEGYIANPLLQTVISHDTFMNLHES